MELTSNFSEEESEQLKAGTHPDQTIKDELARFNHVNKIIETYNKEIASLDQKRPCPIVPERLKLKECEPKGMLDKIKKDAKQGLK